jgi:hypothetical protein
MSAPRCCPSCDELNGLPPLSSDGGEVPDMVNRPPHYTTGTIEVLDFIEDQHFGYLAGQVVKYVARFRHKGAPLEDLKKARFYLDRLIAKGGVE